jgi:hypothetical protein
MELLRLIRREGLSPVSSHMPNEHTESNLQMHGQLSEAHDTITQHNNLRCGAERHGLAIVGVKLVAAFFLRF